jgi:hypothetical protein
MTRGLEMIAAVAEKVDLHLGSRAVDLFRVIVRLSFERRKGSISRRQYTHIWRQLWRSIHHASGSAQRDAVNLLEGQLFPNVPKLESCESIAKTESQLVQERGDQGRLSR